MRGSQSRAVFGADQRVGSRKNEGVRTGSVSARGKSGAGQTGACGITLSGRVAGEAQDAVTIQDSGSVSFTIGVIPLSPLRGGKAAKLRLPVGIGAILRGPDGGDVARMGGCGCGECGFGLVQSRRLNLQRGAQHGDDDQRGQTELGCETEEHLHSPVRHRARSACRRRVSPGTTRPPARFHIRNASHPPRQSPALKRRATVERAKAALPIL